MRQQRAVIRRFATAVLVFWPVLLPGAAFADSPASSPDASVQQRLKDHVYLLARPALKGRQPKTVGSQRARQYIVDHFSECGLRPWGTADAYELPFDAGTNVVGVLPGADPALAERFILVTAHFDHLGIVDGQVRPGATDNASGTAAILELARQLFQAEARSKRSIAFCAFDAEEEGLLGARAFSSRADFRKRRIAAVVNVDMLGHERAGPDGRSLLQLGSKRMVRIQQPLRAAAGREGIDLAPMTVTAMGSDHAVFHNLDIPYLFFCCGIFDGLHGSTDTADRLNYANMQHDLVVIRTAVQALADRPERPHITLTRQPAASRPAIAVPVHLQQAPALPF